MIGNFIMVSGHCQKEKASLNQAPQLPQHRLQHRPGRAVRLKKVARYQHGTNFMAFIKSKVYSSLQQIVAFPGPLCRQLTQENRFPSQVQVGKMQ
jgi:hypothetical protein